MSMAARQELRCRHEEKEIKPSQYDLEFKTVKEEASYGTMKHWLHRENIQGYPLRTFTVLTSTNLLTVLSQRRTTKTKITESKKALRNQETKKRAKNAQNRTQLK
ncbi:hypothetical protein NDU88_006724 [Pleurodeles waltl]|uniref:Uncharacterized protein n=1 Tax=Pleurodeles waltl TaxID=8319 RepID=A0AAV7U187_PLEWA|nr:hypothetical protein NDU88_006724 [Pleurodeles waltl]